MKKDKKVRQAEVNLKAAYEHFNSWALNSDIKEPICDFVYRQIFRLEEVLEAVKKGHSHTMELVDDYIHYTEVIPAGHLGYEGWPQLQKALSDYADAVTFLPYRKTRKGASQ